MGLPRLQSCCGLLDLKTGNVVLGCLNALLSLSLIAVLSAGAAGLAAEQETERGEGRLGEDERAALTGAYVMAVLLIVMFLIKLGFDIAFVYGTLTERAGIIRAYFIMWVVFSLLSISTFFLNVPYFSAGTVITEVFYIGVNVYAVLLSYSFYKLLNEREEV